MIYTAKNCQLVAMALKPKEDIGEEVHTLDQFFRIEEGTGEAVLDGVHTLYAPPNHRDGVVHQTRADAEADNEHFDGKTTE